MSPRACPVPGCGRTLGTTRQGDPYAFCGGHFHRLSRSQQQRLWQAFKAWQRLERKYLTFSVTERPAALLDARALAIKGYLEVRDDCIRALVPSSQQMELAQ